MRYPIHGLRYALSVQQWFQGTCLTMAVQYIPSINFSNPVYSLSSYGENALMGSNKGMVKLLDVESLFKGREDGESDPNSTHDTDAHYLAHYRPSDIDASIRCAQTTFHAYAR